MLILAVDDDADDLELFRDALCHIDSSIKLITAKNGIEAVNFLSKDSMVTPDIIFLDINMPKMDGRECLKYLKTNYLLRRIPVVMHSTTVSDADKATFENLGATFITKASTFSQQVSSLLAVFGTLEREGEPIFLNERSDKRSL